MRRERFFRMERGDAVALLAGAPVMHLASTTPDGAPLLRTLHPVVVDDAVCFHAAQVGEKTEALGRPVVLSAEETVASIPSYFIDAERACPATTLYRSVQVHGTLEAIDASADKARVLGALMAKYQPEGGHVAIDATHPSYGALYDKQVSSLLIGRVRLEHIDGKAKLMQNRSPEERLRALERLWQRGLDGDPHAIERIRAANPDTPTPAFLRFEPKFENSNGGSNCGVTLHCALSPDEVDTAVELLAFEYWNVDAHPRERIAGAIRNSPVWVGARDREGRLIACARAISDGHKYAWIYDVVVAPAWRGGGLGEAVMRLILDHPRVREAARVFLQTRDAQPLYRKFGFIDVADAPARPYPSTSMLRIQRG
jgi:N-acetylglutamate synthase-like GNAT family acetyltransferase/nitroimidazol reductase NimA-like FMN-containing flavoprotein (pyridoxamine 5'-phosphate oxidase superfamily)